MSTRDSFTEIVAPGVRTLMESTRVLHEVRSDGHHKAFFDNTHFGRVLMIDGAVQVTSVDEFVYHEMMGHVPLFRHPAPERVLIIGGGDCGLAEEVLKHPTVKRLEQVEIDGEVVRLSRAYFPAMNAGVFNDPRFTLHIGDGAEFVARTEMRFDVILVDATDPQSVSLPLYSDAFYQAARDRLAEGGMLVAQLGVPFLNLPGFASAIRRIGRVFPDTLACYLASIPSLLGGPLAFAWAGRGVAATSTSLDVLRERFASRAVATRYYTPDVDHAAFVLPRYLQESFTGAIRSE